jgi:hypothetical protein
MTMEEVMMMTTMTAKGRMETTTFPGGAECTESTVSGVGCLSDAQKAAYVASGGSECPFCGGTEMLGHEMNFEGGGIAQEITCQCGRSWWDVYTLSGMEDFE